MRRYGPSAGRGAVATPSTCMPSALALRATAVPMGPAPTTTSTRPASGSVFRYSQVPSRECRMVVASPFAKTSMHPTAYSAMASSKTPRAFVTVMSLATSAG